jgi:autotransporter-associated beta strand protein
LLQAGKIVAGSDTALGVGNTVEMTGGTTLGFIGDDRALANAFILLVGDGNALFDTEVVEGEGKDATLSGWISGAGGLTKNGLGSLTLSYAAGDGNTYAGPTQVNAGTLKGNIRRGTDLEVKRFATYDGAGAGREIGDLTGDGLIQYTAGLTVESGTFSGDIDATNTGGLTKIDSGDPDHNTLTLTGTNLYGGLTRITGGTLAGNIRSGTDLTLENSAVYDGTGEARVIGKLIGSELTEITNVAGTTGLTVTNGGTFAGTIGAGIDLTVDGGDALVLSGTAHVYDATTIRNGGTLSIHQNENLGMGTNTLAGGILQLTGTAYTADWTLGAGSNVIRNAAAAAVDFGGVLEGTGGFTQTGTDVLTLSEANHYDGPTTVGSKIVVTGSLRTNGNDPFVYAGAIGGTGEIAFAQAEDTVQTLAGIVGDALALTVNGEGEVILTKNNTYTGPTTVGEDATLTVTGRLGGDGGLYGSAIVNDGTLTFAQAGNQTLSGDIAGANTGQLTQTGEGTLTLSGTNIGYAGRLTVGGGVLSIGQSANLGSGEESPNKRYIK